MKTQDYQQPNFYHFSQSVIEAAQWISCHFKIFSYQDITLTDLFAGSGIFSLELVHRLPNARLKRWNLVELQTSFSTSLAFNLKTLLDPKITSAPLISYRDCLSWMQDKSMEHDKQDLIILNPPHYFEDEGKLSPNAEKRKCLSIERYYWEQFLHECQKSNGKIFMLLNHQTQLYQFTKKILKTKIKLMQPLAGQDCLLYIN